MPAAARIRRLCCMTTHAMTDNTLHAARQPAPSSNPLPRLGAATGVLGFALAIGAIVVGATSGTTAANPGATTAEIAQAYATAASPATWVGAMLQVIAL